MEPGWTLDQPDYWFLEELELLELVPEEQVTLVLNDWEALVQLDILEQQAEAQ